jgi:RNA polymerase sigma-70 factor (ECF subfamily)
MMKNSIHQILQSSYPQALSRLILLLKSIDLAEDYLQEAVEKALNNWPQKQPELPVAWLVTTARNSYIDHYRKQKKQADWSLQVDESEQVNLEEKALEQSYNDDLLRLIFTSCHPALSIERQILLSLKHVLGLSVEEIAQAMVLKSTNVQQKLLRAKHKIAATGIQYHVPDKKEWSPRLSGVLKTIYLLFNQGYFASEQHSFIRLNLCSEAIRLAQTLLACTNGTPEVAALLALLLHQDARRPARIDRTGNLVLLSEQNRDLWLQDKIQTANQLVIQSLAKTGRSYYGLQAAIAALHNNAKTYQETDWQQIHQLYLLLIEIDNNPIIELNAAVALAQTGKHEEAIQIVKSLQEPLKHYQHYCITLAGLYFNAKRFEQAADNYKKALNVSTNYSQQKFIESRLALCQSEANKRTE